MANYQGKVSKIYESRYGGSFGLEGQDRLYFNTKQVLPAFVVQGAVVKFEGNLGRNGKSFYVDDGSLSVVAGPATPAGVGTSSIGRDDSIKYQSSRKDAIATVDMLLRAGALWNPEKPPVQSKRAGVIEAALDRFTAIYFEDIEILGALERTPAPVPQAQTPAKVDEELPE